MWDLNAEGPHSSKALALVGKARGLVGLVDRDTGMAFLTILTSSEMK